MSTQNEPSDAAVRKFLERLYRRHPGAPFETQILIGQLPPGWDIPLPQNATVVGTESDGNLYAQVVLDVPGQPEEAVAAIEQTLIASGWDAREPFGGFVGGFDPGHYAGRLLCDDEHHRHLDTVAARLGDGLSDVRLRLNSDPSSYGLCEESWMDHDTMSVFPALSAPPGTSQRYGGGSGSSDGSAHTTTLLFGQVSSEAVEEHYRGQLATAGWTLIDHGSSVRSAWSAWDFTGEHDIPWTGLLTIIEPTGQANIRRVSLIASTAYRGP